MAQPFVVDANLRIQRILGLEGVKQQLAGIQVGGIAQTDQLKKGFTSLNLAGLDLARTTRRITDRTADLGKSTKKVGRQMKDATRKTKNFGDAVFLAGRRYGAFIAATTVAFKGIQLIGAGTKSVIEFDQAMVSLSQILDTSVDQLGDLSQQFLDLSVTTGTSAAEIADAAKLLAQAGFRGSELTEAVEQLAKVPLTPIFENMDQAVDGAIAAMRQFSQEGLTVEDVFDKMINVSNKYAASFPEIIEGLKRGGSAFQAIGGTLDEFIAAFTTIRSVTRESASAVGTSLKTLSSRLADPKIIKFLETKNIRLLEQGQFVGPLEAIRRVGKGLENTLNVQDKINIAVQLGGRRQISRFLAVAQNFEKTNEILGVSKDSFGEFNKVAEQGLQAIGKQIDILVAQAKKLAIELGEGLFIPFIQGLTGAAEGAITLLSALKPILPTIAKIGAAFAGAAIFRGVGGFLGSKLGKLAGPAAFAAAGGGFKGAKAGLAASPFVQAGLLVAASEAAAALTKTAEGADSFTGTLITSIASITAAITLFRGQTIAQFAAGGGLFPSLGKAGKLGALGGTIATAGAIAAPLLILEASRSAKELSEKIVENAIESVSKIEISPIDPKSLASGISDIFDQLVQSGEELIRSADVRSDPSLKKIFQGLGRSVNNIIEGDIEALIRRGGLTSGDVKEQHISILEKSIDSIIQNIANSISQAGEDIPTVQRPFEPRRRLIEAGVEAGKSFREATNFAQLIIEAGGGLEEFVNKVNKSAEQIRKESDERKKIIQLTKAFLPNKLVGQLLQFSKAVDKTTKVISTSAKLFESQIAEIAGGISAPTFDFDFGAQQVERFIGGGGLKELFASTPDIPRFVGALNEMESLLDNFIINISNLPSTDIDVGGEIDKFFEFQKDVPKAVRDNFERFFNTIATDIQNVSEGKFIDTDEIKKRFREEFESLGVGASDAVVESITSFMNATFAQIQDELNRLATVRQFELEAPVRPETQAAFLEQQLKRVGISTDIGRGSVNALRGTLEELDLLRKEAESRGGRRNIPGLLPTPQAGFFQGRDQRLADIAGDEKIRQQVRDSFQEVVIESANLKKRLAELQPGTEGFIAASNRAKELARSTIELQTTLEALDQATQQALESERQTLTLRQKLELEQTRARLAERVRTGALRPIQAERTLFDLGKEQEKAQIALQDRFDTIIEKDNALRVSLAQEISASTQTQAEIIQNFGSSTSIFADATRLQVTAIDLMGKHIIDFGQAVVDFTNVRAAVQQTGGENVPGITPAQIRAGSVTEQQGLDELNKLVNEGNVSQETMIELLRAISESSQPIEQEKVNTPKEQERDTETSEKISQLTESLDNLRTVLNEPNELKLITDQRIDLDLSTLPSDISEEVRPKLEEAALIVAKTVTRKALESLAAKSESEISIAAIDTAQELI